jgi:tripartite-type tricarboxylate transporter receptor subunit TctC
MRAVRVFLAFFAAALAAAAAAQEPYPSRPIRLVIDTSPGGVTDLFGRVVAEALAPRLGQTIYVDNKPGASGNVAADFLARSAPDGYTLMIASGGGLVVKPFLERGLTFDVMNDLLPVFNVAEVAHILVVPASVPAANVAELIALAKAQPGKLSYAHPGMGTNPHLGAELFKQMGGVDMVGVSYKGGGPAIVAVIGNEAQVSFATAPSSIPHVKSGRLRALAVTSGQRSAALPELPTISESGVPGYDVVGWVGLFAPTKTPAKIIARLHDEAVKVMAMPEVKETVLASGAETVGNTSAELARIMHAENAMWAKVIKSVGVKME